MELRPRKNHLGLLRSWLMATHRDDDAILILKAGVFQSRVLPQFQADAWEMQQRIGHSLMNAAPILVIAESLPDHAIRSLYASATHYISMSHGEGWDQPMMEAAVSGLQVIAPSHTTYVTYLTDQEAHFIPAPAGAATFEGRLGAEDSIFFDGLNWWNPDEEAAAALIRGIVSGEIAPKRSPKNRIVAEYTWAKAAARLLEVTL